MMRDAAFHFEIPLEEDRYVEILRQEAWRKLTHGFDEAFAVQAIYEGFLPGIAAARVTRYQTGNLDADTRILIDATPASLTPPVVAAGRSVARAFATRTSDRTAMLQRLAVVLHVVEPLGETVGSPPIRVRAGLAGALAEAQSPGHPEVSDALRRSATSFEPTVVLQLADAPGATPRSDLVLLLARSGLSAVDGASRVRAGDPGWAEARALAEELRVRDLQSTVGTPDERASSGVIALTEGVIARVGASAPALGVADAAVATCGAVGLAAVSVRTAEARRAAALCGAAAAVVAACVRDFRGTPA